MLKNIKEKTAAVIDDKWYGFNDSITVTIDYDVEDNIYNVLRNPWEDIIDIDNF